MFHRPYMCAGIRMGGLKSRNQLFWHLLHCNIWKSALQNKINKIFLCMLSLNGPKSQWRRFVTTTFTYSYSGIRGSIHDHTLRCAKSSSMLFLHDVSRTCFNFVQRKGFSSEMISHLRRSYACMPRRVYRFSRKVRVFYR